MAKFLHKYGGSTTDYAFFPVVGDSNTLLAAVDPATGKLVSVLGINPW
jgi:hypothetical protein